MDKNRIVNFLNSLEERGLLTTNQQSVVLKKEADAVVAAGPNSGCTNSLAKSCGGIGTSNTQCINKGDACAGSMNDACFNKPADTGNTNMSTQSCRQ